MGNDLNTSNGLRLIQLSSDTYAVQHPCLLSPMKTVKIGGDLFIIYSNTVDPVIYSARLLDLWQKGDVLYLKLWNFNKNKMEMYWQNLRKDESLFLFVSMPFINYLGEIKVRKPKNSQRKIKDINAK
jgi:hypothetical protein